jgi:1-deoxy-D-xylulose-5-phosphate synthase
VTAVPAGRLAGIRCPADLRAVPATELPALADEIRGVLLDTVRRTGGHLGPNLGVVELTLAVHRVFDSPRDRVVWDTGHQSYVHKLLTGRQEAFGTLRQGGGLAGYPSRAESEHDLVENSHASTALAWADGLSRACALRAESDRTVVAVIGDGALTGGLAWEALNNLGAAAGRPVVIVLNDNGRSYAPTVGGLAAHLAELRAGRGGSLFTALGLGYLGPVDGHDVVALEAALREARDRRTPTVVHCVTTKGRGHRPAEEHDLDRMHAVSPAPLSVPVADPRAVPAPVPAVPRPVWTAVVGAEIARLADEDPRVVAVTAAMLDPTGLSPAAAGHPDRVVDVGIAEQHAVTSAAGLATGGLHPVVCVYATFLNRAFDQVLMDVALHRLPVTFVLDRAGITGPDGASHHGMWDLTLLGAVPGMRVAAPRDTETTRELLAEAVADDDGPTAVRFPKGRVGPSLPALGRIGGADLLARPAGRAEVLIVAAGPLAAAAVAAAAELTADGVPTAVADPRWLLPVDPALVEEAGRHRLVLTLEDNGVAGGFGDAVARALRDARVRTQLVTLGLPQRFVPHGEREPLLAAAGLDAAGVVRRVREALGPVAARPAQEKRRARAR